MYGFLYWFIYVFILIVRGVDLLKVIKVENKMCLLCMQEHPVYIVEIEDTQIYNWEAVTFVALYEYCKLSDECLETEDFFKYNNISMKKAYEKIKNK